MARRVLLHIGTMKSATTYVQGLCDANVEQLSAAGLLWTGGSDNFLATEDLLGTRRPRPGLEGAWRAMSGRLRDHEGDALISNELLGVVGASKIGVLVDATAPAEVHVIITARDLGRVIPSQWQTTTRNRHTGTWPDFITGLCGGESAGSQVSMAFWRKHDIARMVRRWSKRVPLDRISIVTVPPAGSPAALFGERFCAAISVDPSALEQPPNSNTSLGGHSAELLRRLNQRTTDLDWLHYMWGFRYAMARLVLTELATNEPRITLNRDQLTWATGRAREMVRAIADIGVRVVGDLDDLVPAADAPARAVDPTRASDAELLDAAVDALVGMGRLYADLRVDYEALVRGASM